MEFSAPPAARRSKMSESFDRLKNALRKLPGTGLKSAERMAMYLALENRADAAEIAESIAAALGRITPCPECFGLSEGGLPCGICSDASRIPDALCVVEKASDIAAIEKSGAWRGKYHVLGGKLSPIKKIGPEKLNLASLAKRAEESGIAEITLALSNDIEAEATCHYIQERVAAPLGIRLTRIGFGLPSGSQLGFADSGTIKSALESRKAF